MDQLETSLQKEKKGVTSANREVLERELTRIYTIGTLVDENLIGSSDSTYLLSICENLEERKFGLVFAETATGHFKFCYLEGTNRNI